LITKTENLIPEQLSEVKENTVSRTSKATMGKKEFVEPEVSFPVDVLEATTFFQLTDSGATN
jgi:hypothetical protein